MGPDYERGKKVREKGGQNHGTVLDRFRRATRLAAIHDEILCDLVKKGRRPNLLSKSALDRRVAAKYEQRCGERLSYKTVQRDRASLRRLLKNLDKPGLSK
jgi:hypothetical protein